MPPSRIVEAIDVIKDGDPSVGRFRPERFHSNSALIVLKKVSTAALSQQLSVPFIDAQAAC